MILVLRALGLGDLLTSVPALRAIADAFEDEHRILAAPRALEPLADLVRTADGRPAVHEVAHTRPLGSLPPSLHRPAVAVNLHGRGPQSHRLLLATRPGRLIAFAHAALPETRGGPRWRRGEHEVGRWCRMLEGHGIAADPRALRIDAPAAPAPDAARGAVVVHPGAASPARRWPAERWAAVVRAQVARGHEVLVTGGPDEAPLAAEVTAAGGLHPSASLAGRTDLAGLAAVVAAAERVICGDTGVAHLATALGTPSVVLFGPTSPAEWGPPPVSGIHRVLWRGRTGDPHADTPDPGLLDIGVDEVLAATECAGSAS